MDQLNFLINFRFGLQNLLFFQTLNALGKSWHPEHFVCLVCQKPITNSTFNEREGQPVCPTCFAQKYCEKCYHCKKPIVGVIKTTGGPITYFPLIISHLLFPIPGSDIQD